MILFAGSEERGYFLEEPAKTKKMKVEYLGNAISIETQLTAILEKTMQYLVIDIEQYIDKADELATKIESIKRAKNCNVKRANNCNRIREPENEHYIKPKERV